MSWLDSALPGNRVQGSRASNRQPVAKRGTEQHTRETAMKKGRSAFGDLTNCEGYNSNVPAPVDKGEQKAPKSQELENGAVLQQLLGLPHSVDPQQADKENDAGITAMECEASQAHTAEWVDIDSGESSPLTCASIANDIMGNMFVAERLRRPKVNYMSSTQTDLSQHMRGILVDWLVEVAQEYKLVSETLYLTVDYLDRYLSAVPLQRSQLQLLGVACMLLASKFEEIYAPSVEDFCFITENTYSREQLLAMERSVLNALDFELAVPTIRFFLRRFVKAAAASSVSKPDPRLDVLSSYVAELSLLDVRSARFLPSQLAASAVLLAQYCLAGAQWNATLEHYTSYSAADLRECTSYLWQCYTLSRRRGLPAVTEKYRSPKYGCISESNPPSFLPQALFA